MKHPCLTLVLFAASVPAAFGAAADAPLSLPLADSFAGGRMASFWTPERVSGNFDWEAAARPEDTPSPDPSDGDGGLLYYHAYRSMKGNTARLATAPIDAATATAPVVQFQFYHHTAGNDLLKIQVSADGGEWADVAGSEITVRGDEAGWKRYEIPLAGALPAGTSRFRVALTAVSAYGFNIVVDDVRVFNMAGRDLSARLSSAGPLVAGRGSELLLEIANNGAAAVSAGEYSIAFSAPDGVTAGTPVPVDVPALGTVVIPVSVAVDALAASAAGEFGFRAEVAMDGDEDASNDAASLSVAAAFSDSPAVTGAGIERIDGADVLSWNHAIDPDYAPIALREGFEGYDDGFRGPFGGWTALDLDGKDGGSVYNADGPALNVGVIPEGSSWRNLVRGFEGDGMLCVTIPSGAQQDDWLISPPLAADPKSTLTLSFRIGFRNFSVAQTNNFEILYTNSDGELDPSRPSALLNAMFEDVKVNVPAASSGTSDPVDLAEMTFEGIPASARRVAIHFKSKMTSYVPNAIWLDCLSLTEENPVALYGYNVYELGSGRLNGEPVPAGTNSFVIPAATDGGIATRRFFVTAHYNDGESAPSETVELKGAQSSVADLPGAELPGQAPEYYNLQGIRVSDPAPGQMVIRVSGTRADKVVAR